MKRRVYAAPLAILLVASVLMLHRGRHSDQVPGARAREAIVTRVVDGDTLKISTGETVRLIGVDTPETVDPRRPVERFGREASAFTKRMAEGKKVRLEPEGSSNKDKYGRTLAYVWLLDGKLLNAEIIRQGYGHAYVQYPFSRMETFRAFEKEAREQGRGLWADVAPGEPASTATERRVVPPARANSQDESTVYVTNTGTRFHREGCQHLKSRIPMQRARAIRSGYAPCKECEP
jgi:micrococcal nuclease